jgi:hypothetical protein
MRLAEKLDWKELNQEEEIEVVWRLMLFKASPKIIQMLEMYRVIRNDCRGFNKLSYTIHLR